MQENEIFHTEGWMFRSIVPDMGYDIFIENKKLYIVNFKEDINDLLAFYSTYYYPKAGIDIIISALSNNKDEEKINEALLIESFRNKNKEYVKNYIVEELDLEEIKNTIKYGNNFFTSKTIDFTVNGKKFKIANISKKIIIDFKYFLERNSLPEGYLSQKEINDLLTEFGKKQEQLQN